MLRSFLIFCCVSLAPGIAYAQVIEHAPVLVEAERSFIDEVDADYLSAHVSVIKRSDFDTKVATVADVLRNETGVQIRQIGGLGSFSTVNIRGSNSRQVNVYLNGVLLNGAFGGAVDLSQFSLDNVDQIEVYRGSAPVTLGFSGIGGAINIKTRDYSGQPLRQIKLGLGSLETKNLAITISDRLSENDVFFSGEYLGAENDFGFSNNNLTPLYHGDDFSDRRNNAGFEQYTGLFSLQRDLNEKINISWVSQYFDKHDNFPDVYNDEDNFAELDTRFFSTQTKFNYSHNQQLNFGIKANLSTKTEHYLDTGNNVGLGVNDEQNQTENYGLEFLSEYSVGSHLLSLSLDNKLEDYTKQDFVDNTEFEYRRIQSVFGLQDEWLSQDGSLQLSLGGQYFYLRDKAALVEKDDSRNYSNVYFGLLYSLNPQFHFHSNISRNIRIPQLYELYGDRGLFVGNEELLPETAINGDFGIRYDSMPLVSKASIFYRYLTDGISISYGSQGVGKALNISKSRVIGFEADNSYQVSKALTAQMRTTVQDSSEISKSRDRDGNSLPGLYTFSNTVALKLVDGAMVYGVEYRHQSGGFFDESNSAVIPSQNQTNLSVRWVSKETSVDFRVDNVTNDRFLEFNRYPMPGRRLFVVFKTNF